MKKLLLLVSFIPGFGKMILAQDTSNVPMIDTNMVSDLPTPLDYSQVFRTKGKYHREWLVNPAQRNAHASVFSKAINSGIYFEDLAYAMANDQSQDFNAYVNAVKSLYNELGLPFLDHASSERIRKNDANTDSLSVIISERHMLCEEFLSQHNKKEISLLINIGANIEALYLFCQDAMLEKSGQLQSKLNDQKFIFEEFETALGRRKAEADYGVLQQQITALKDMITPKMGAEQLKKFTDAVAKLRNDIVKG